jgi:hypothetical protein
MTLLQKCNPNSQFDLLSKKERKIIEQSSQSFACHMHQMQLAASNPQDSSYLNLIIPPWWFLRSPLLPFVAVIDMIHVCLDVGDRVLATITFVKTVPNAIVQAYVIDVFISPTRMSAATMILKTEMDDLQVMFQRSQVFEGFFTCRSTAAEWR